VFEVVVVVVLVQLVVVANVESYWYSSVNSRLVSIVVPML
jgi:hypothetical protein